MSHKTIVALDKMSEEEVRQIIVECACSKYNQLAEKVTFKINDLLEDIGLKWLKEFIQKMKDNLIDINDIHWMLDPKRTDISNTLCHYIERLHARKLENIDFVTIMATNWPKWMKKMVEKRNELWLKTKILAVTVFTTFDNWESIRTLNDTVKHQVLKSVKNALEAGVDGIVCSPLEAEMLREVYSNYDFEIVTPGVRLANKEIKWDDQMRITTPEDAINMGSSHIVIWRPITQSNDKVWTIKEIVSQMEKWEFKANKKSKYTFEKILYNGTWGELLKYVWAIYKKPKKGAYVRLASKLLSDGYINIWTTERNFRVLDRASLEIAEQINNRWIEADIVMGAQMWSVRLSGVLGKALDIETSIYTEKDGMEVKTSNKKMTELLELLELAKKGDKDGVEITGFVDVKDGINMILKRHDMDLTGMKIILSEDVITKWSTITKMIKLIKEKWWEVVAVTSVVNRYGKDNFDGIPFISCYQPEPFNLFYDENTPENARGDNPPLPEGAKIVEKAKNAWNELVNSMFE